MMRESLAARFRGAYGGEPALEARAPGRVNLLGEHIDYCGLPVLPMALQRGITLVARPRSGAAVRVTNLSPDFPERRFRMSPEIPPLGQGDWGNYAQAAARAVIRRYPGVSGIDAVVGSDLPIAAGLSSSAALVVAVALALLGASGIEYDPAELMELLAEGERYVGTAGGGMDQAICLGAREGHAARIDFHPVRLTHVPVPPDWRFVVAWSRVHAEKSGPAQRAYNERTRETADARATVAARLGLGTGATYGDLLAARPVPELLEAADDLPSLLRRRFRHVVTEASRVVEGVAAMEQSDPERFGEAMNGSHESLRDDYEVSTPELDSLTAIARDGGAAGARLTGAGFGGCIVALATRETAPAVLNAIREQYYGNRSAEMIASWLFLAEPGPGATVTPL